MNKTGVQRDRHKRRGRKKKEKNKKKKKEKRKKNTRQAKLMIVMDVATSSCFGFMDVQKSHCQVREGRPLVYVDVDVHRYLHPRPTPLLRGILSEEIERGCTHPITWQSRSIYPFRDRMMPVDSIRNELQLNWSWTSVSTGFLISNSVVWNRVEDMHV